jgi:2-ketocyclohexanecarboxyl-CoA hydrolase
VLADLSIAADTATFGQNGPKVGSFDAGLGSSYLARVVGEKRAREIWFMLRRLSAEEALDWGLVNRVVPAADLKSEVRKYADTMLSYSPTALKVLKQSFNTDTEHMISIGNMAYTTLKLFGESEEAKEGITAFNEKRQPDFGSYRTH